MKPSIQDTCDMNLLSTSHTQLRVCVMFKAWLIAVIAITITFSFSWTALKWSTDNQLKPSQIILKTFLHWWNNDCMLIVNYKKHFGQHVRYRTVGRHTSFIIYWNTSLLYLFCVFWTELLLLHRKFACTKNKWLPFKIKQIPSSIQKYDSVVFKNVSNETDLTKLQTFLLTRN